MTPKSFILFLIFSNASFGEFLSVPDRYTTLRTIAGLGDQEDGNFWKNTYEGANPRLVELSNPHDCGTDAFGRVLIVDKESHSILRISADGSTLTTVAGSHSGGNGTDLPTAATSVDLLNPNGLHVFADGSFLILDTDNTKIRHVDVSGICHTKFQYPNGFGAGRGLTASPDGSEIYFCGEISGGTNQLVKKWTEAGITTVATIPSGIRGLGNIALAPDGALFVTSAGDNRVYRISENDAPEIVAGNGLEDGNILTGSLATQVALNRVRGIAILADGTFFLATQKGGDIWWVDNGVANDGVDRRIHLFLSGADNGNVISGDGLSRVGSIDRISEPRALHIATNGDLLITTNDTGVIRAIRNVCKPVAPALSLKKNQLSWLADWNQSLQIEWSPSLIDPDWNLAASFTALFSGTQTVTFSPGTPKAFFRLRAPQFAGGN